MAAWVAGIAKWIAIESNRARARQHNVIAPVSRNHPIDDDALRVRSPAELFDAKQDLPAIATTSTRLPCSVVRVYSDDAEQMVGRASRLESG